jgi:hypothetical protein
MTGKAWATLRGLTCWLPDPHDRWTMRDVLGHRRDRWFPEAIFDHLGLKARP